MKSDGNKRYRRTLGREALTSKRKKYLAKNIKKVLNIFNTLLTIPIKNLVIFTSL